MEYGECYCMMRRLKYEIRERTSASDEVFSFFFQKRSVFLIRCEPTRRKFFYDSCDREYGHIDDVFHVVLTECRFVDALKEYLKIKI